MDSHAGDYRDIKAAAIQLFSYRNGHSWPPRIAARAGWADRYSQEATGLRVLADLDAAMAWANEPRSSNRRRLI